MDRRDFLTISAGLLASSSFPSLLAAQERPVFAGWHHLPHATQGVVRGTWDRFCGQLRGTGSNKRMLLWRFYEAAFGGPFEPHYQDIGDCVGQAAALGVDVLAAVQIHLHHRPELWRGKSSTEAIYAGSRVEIGGSKVRGDGSTCAWAAKWLQQYGALLRGKYGKWDLTQYSPDLARQWGSPNVGVPDELEPLCKQHPVCLPVKVENWRQACDLVANGYPVIIGSNVGYENVTNADGFLERGRRPWHHAMLLWGIDTVSSQEAGCIANSWGRHWISGPQHALGTPAGCFWTYAKNIDAAIRQGDSYALTLYRGYPRLDYLLI